ncbi:MAG: hypothetical protein J2P36_22435 [Ktedonobacteraceae bacterium]|nr:hypothetical protein [Ktedonobacteraceae bacterium]
MPPLVGVGMLCAPRATGFCIDEHFHPWSLSLSESTNPNQGSGQAASLAPRSSLLSTGVAPPRVPQGSQDA